MNEEKKHLTNLLRNRIAKYRERAGISKYRLAKDLGITRAHASRIEDGSSCPSLNLSLEICKRLDCKMKDLFYLDFTLIDED